MTELAQRPPDALALFKADLFDKHAESFARIMGAPDKATAFLQECVNAVGENPDLLLCDRKSLLRGCMNVAQLGLSLERNLGWCYLIPRSGKATMQIGYRGWIHMIFTESSLFVTGEIVRQGDAYQFQEGTNPLVIYTPLTGNTAPVLCAWAVARLPSGVCVGVKQIGFEEIEKLRALNESEKRGKFSPWQTAAGWRAMAISKAIRRLLKTLPAAGARVQRAITIEEIQEHEAARLAWPRNAREILMGARPVVQPAQVGPGATTEAQAVPPPPAATPEPGALDLGFDGPIPEA
jgi:phage RecT family recombinase